MSFRSRLDWDERKDYLSFDDTLSPWILCPITTLTEQVACCEHGSNSEGMSETSRRVRLSMHPHAGMR